MHPSRAALSATQLAFVVILATGCDDSLTGPVTGALSISAQTSGDDIDPDGFTATVDGRPGLLVGRGDSGDSLAIVANLSPGNHIVRLDHVEGNCAVSGDNPRNVNVVAGDTAHVSFTVGCVPRTGSIRVMSATTGSELDPDGYVVTVDAGPPQSIGVNAAVTIAVVPVGNRSILLTGVDRNCVVAPPNPRTVGVLYGDVTDVSFAVHCETGTLIVTTATSGVDLDQDGYRVMVSGARLDTVVTAAANGTATIARLPVGDYEMRLRGVAANCDRTGPDLREAAVAGGRTTTVTFGVVCVPFTKLAFVSERDGNAEIYTINSNGTDITRLTNSTGPDVEPAWAPDGSRIAFRSNRDGNEEIYLVNSDGSGAVRLTNEISADYRPAWSPDGRRVAFVAERDMNPEIYVMNADGSGQVRLTNDSGRDLDPAWSPDGTRIAFTRDGNVYVMNADGSGVTWLTASPDHESQPAWSPDGERIAFTLQSCNDSFCLSSIYVMTGDGRNVRPVAPGFTHADPTWSADGRRIAFTASRCLDLDCNAVESVIMFVNEDGTEPTELVNGEGYQPSWRR